MLTFWQGAGAGLLGAIVGGLSTGLGAMLQAKACMNAVKYELRETFDHERVQREKEATRQALDRAIVVLSDLTNLLLFICGSHGLCKGKECTRNDIPVAELNGVLRRLQVVNNAYREATWPTLAGYDLENLDDDLNYLIDSPCAKEVPNHIVDKGRPLTFTEEAVNGCYYGLAAGYIDTMGRDYIISLREFRDGIKADQHLSA
jgi:hypothetical protein